MRRQYLATYDDGHDYGSFTFMSEHRAGSEANKRDAMKESYRLYGFRRAAQIIITSISRYDAR